jgi:hypothetical protein
MSGTSASTNRRASSKLVPQMWLPYRSRRPLFLVEIEGCVDAGIQQQIDSSLAELLRIATAQILGAPQAVT